MQKNLTELPVSTFEQIEDIIDAPSNLNMRNQDIYGTRSVPRKRMADTYKRVREISTKYGANEHELELILSRFLKGDRKKSIKSIGQDVNHYYEMKMKSLRQSPNKIQGDSLLHDDIEQRHHLHVPTDQSEAILNADRMIYTEEGNGTGDIRVFSEYVKQETEGVNIEINEYMKVGANTPGLVRR